MLSILFQHLKMGVLKHSTMQNKTILTEDKMSLLSNYCENTKLTATNTCVPSSKLDILNFKKLSFPLKRQQKNSSYFTSIISQVLFICLVVLPHLSVMPIFNIRQGSNSLSKFADDANWGLKWSIHQRALSKEAVESPSLKIFKT